MFPLDISRIAKNSYDDSPQKQLGRDAILPLYKEFVYHTANTSAHNTFGGLPALSWEFEKQLAEVIKHSPKTFTYYAYEDDSMTYRWCKSPTYQVNQLGGMDAYKRLNPLYTRGDVFKNLVAANIIYLDLCGGFTQHNLGRLRNLLKSFGDQVVLFFITFDRKWRYKRYAPVEARQYEHLYDELPIVDANSIIVREVLPLYLPVNQPVLSYEYKNGTCARSTHMITLGYNFSSIPFTNTFFGNENSRIEPIRDSVVARDDSHTLVGATHV